MQATDIQLYARQMFEEQGPRAIVAAAEKALRFERAGDAAQAQQWRRIESALMIMRWPRET